MNCFIHLIISAAQVTCDKFRTNVHVRLKDNFISWRSLWPHKTYLTPILFFKTSFVFIQCCNRQEVPTPAARTPKEIPLAPSSCWPTLPTTQLSQTAQSDVFHYENVIAKCSWLTIRGGAWSSGCTVIRGVWTCWHRPQKKFLSFTPSWRKAQHTLQTEHSLRSLQKT